MRDPYDVLGLTRGASLDEIKAAYRRLSKQRHPDLGGSNEAMAELNAAYAFILNEVKAGYQRQQQSETREQTERQAGEAWHDVHEEAAGDARRDNWWRDRYREIDEELETLRRYAEQYDDQLKTMRAAAWRTGHHAAWAQLTLEDLARFLLRTARSGVKGIALLFAALVGFGSVLVEANVISAIIMIGAGLGVFVSLALKNDKGGVMSAALLLFGVMTIWLPPVRGALLTYPLATICVLMLLGLIFKFTQAGGMVGFMTGGVLALYVILVIVSSMPHANAPPGDIPTWTPSPGAPPGPPPTVQPSPPQKSPEPLTLLASDGAILKFAAGVSYRLKVRTGRSTALQATSGTVRIDSGEGASNHCVDSLRYSSVSGAGPWRDIDATLRSCGGDALMIVRLGT